MSSNMCFSVVYAKISKHKNTIDSIGQQQQQQHINEKSQLDTTTDTQIQQEAAQTSKENVTHRTIGNPQCLALLTCWLGDCRFPFPRNILLWSLVLDGVGLSQNIIFAFIVGVFSTVTYISRFCCVIFYGWCVLFVLGSFWYSYSCLESTRPAASLLVGGF